MKYTIEIDCTSASYEFFVIDTVLFRQLISVRDNNERFDYFFMKIKDRGDFLLYDKNPKRVLEEFSLAVKDESGKLVYSTANIDDIPIKKVNTPRFVVPKCLIFLHHYELDVTHTVLSLETDGFDKEKLFFANCEFNNYPDNEYSVILANLKYDGAKLVFEKDNENDVDVMEDEYYYYEILRFNEKNFDCERLDPDELENYKMYIIN